MATVAATLHGGVELQAKLRGFVPRIANKVLSQALRKGAKPIHQTAVRWAPKQTGQLKASIKIRNGKTRAKNDRKIVIITGKGFFKGDEFYAGFVEYGHRIGKRSRAVAHLQEKKSRTRDVKAKAKFAAQGEKIDKRERVPAKPFLRPAFDLNKDTALRIIKTEIAAGIEREALKIATEGARADSLAFLGGARSIK